MKKSFLSFFAALCTLAMVSCGGNAVIEQINQLVIDATEQTLAATSAEEIVTIANNLQAEMNKIEAESGDKLTTLGDKVDESLAKYQEAAAAKLVEFSLKVEEKTEEQVEE